MVHNQYSKTMLPTCYTLLSRNYINTINTTRIRMNNRTEIILINILNINTGHLCYLEIKGNGETT